MDNIKRSREEARIEDYGNNILLRMELEKQTT